MKTSSRIFLTAVAVAIAWVGGWLNYGLNAEATMGAARAAGGQFLPSDNAYLTSTLGAQFFSALHLPVVLPLLVVIGLIWWRPAYKWIVALGMVAIVIAAWPHNADAYYSKSNYAEPYFILPNETAFWIPDVGDNKSSQAQFKSKEYYDEKKVATKRFDIPHSILSNSGLFSDFYVPAGRLIVVDLAPYSREWTKAGHRGTSTKDESFPCQSQEGINITLEVSIGVSLHEDSASTYLAHFGVEPIGDRNDPNVLFTSVLHARRLTNVMDTVGRNKVQALMCNEMTTRTFIDANHEAFTAMESAKQKAEAYLKSVGITLDYLGWAGTMEFDKEVQQAINDRFSAEYMRPVLDVARQQAINTAITKWQGQFPSLSGLWVIPSDFWTSVTEWFSAKVPAAAAAVPAKK